METRKDSLSLLKLCRFCLSNQEPLRNMYDRRQERKNVVPLNLKILSCLSVEVFPSDKMPAYICQRCSFFISCFYEYKNICRRADENIFQFIKTGMGLEQIVWPRALLKLYQQEHKSKPIVKTVVEGGATVEVTSQDVSESGDDDENVYDVKIADGSDEESSTARIKVVTNKTAEIKKEQCEKGFSSVSKLFRHVRTHAGERSYPCKHCNKNFVKSHHYTRHLRMKHPETIRSARNSTSEQFRCEQCDDTFTTQDDLIYHSAIHATQNLTCPLCQEKFPDVDAVTAHIKSHVTGDEYMCDFCELVFTTKEKLNNHTMMAHDEEFQNSQSAHDESSMDMDAEEEDDPDMNVKEEGDEMIVEIKKPRDFLIPGGQIREEKMENIISEESEQETTYTELATVDTLAIMRKEPPPLKPAPKVATMAIIESPVKDTKQNVQTATILRKAEEAKRKVVQQNNSEASVSPDKKEKPKFDFAIGGGTSDKSLRLLEKELQELKRTNTRNEVPKPAKPVETVRSNRRPQIHTSTPKPRNLEEKKLSAVKAPQVIEKKTPERRVITKENKEPKESKANNSGVKEDKEQKETKAKEEKDKEIVKSVIKNGNAEKSSDDSIRRSTRPSKIKDYAKMIRDRSQVVEDEDTDEDDEEYIDEKTETRPKPRRAITKPQPPPAPAKNAKAVNPTPRKRGRPRKEPVEVPPKVKKGDTDEEEESNPEKEESEESNKPKETEAAKEKNVENNNKPDAEEVASSGEPKNSKVLVSPTGPLKKIPVKALPPGVRPLPLPMNPRAGEICDMQIGAKMMKVQKIVMTKADVEAMAKKGLIELKDGTMVLKQGIKLPSTPDAIRSSLVGQETRNESPTPGTSKGEKSTTPMRCDFEGNV